MKKKNFSIENCLPDITTNNIREEILSGLTADQKYISSKYFYDKEGSLLFEKITELEEYYPTLTEKSIIKSNAGELVKDIAGTTIVELGSGDCSKIFLLLDAISREDLKTLTYVPVDFSHTAIKDSTECLDKKYPELRISGVAADFLHGLEFISKQAQKIVCLFGSTIGNLLHHEAITFIKDVGSKLNSGDSFILGMDMVKDKTILERAYNDSQQITAAFNKNILNAINAIIKTEIDPDNFEHKAFFKESENRIEMHLIALSDLKYYSPYSEKAIILKEGESIHTENSHKFTEADIYKFAALSGLTIRNIFTDKPNRWFSLVIFER